MTDFDKMTNGELDRAVAAIMERFITRDGDEVIVCVDDDNTELILVHDDWRVTWSPSTEPGDFDDVEHWIEQQGWSWICSYNAKSGRYYFRIMGTDHHTEPANRDSKTRAGCIAFLQMLEKSHGDF